MVTASTKKSNEVKNVKVKSTNKESKLKSQVKGLKEEVLQANDKLVRLQAEFANYKKRTDKEKEELGTFVRAEMLKKILPVKDDFDRMMSHIDESKEKIIEGISLIGKNFDQLFEQYNVSRMNALGNEFDPELHEALMMQPVEDDKDDDKILQVLEEGYVIGDKVIRHARVVVGKKE